ncbi:MAG: inorganic phosphate transporter [Bacteroidota bacterium]|nr:inorganic phosphate transporter [Bacteroidota bacterium]
METIFIVMVGILVLLAIVDLVVGVSNDAVNFLVSAIGSKAASFRVIMIIASLGVLFGATFSSGMMEVARKGIFHPELFSFDKIMIIFLAVMLTDVILLDMFNSLGLPTSTTVSIVFELLGAAVAIGIIVMNQNGESLDHLGKYINTSKALAIIGGILLSVVVAFSLGALTQYLSRLLFSFNYKETYKKYGAVWGGFAITAITYFILIKGLKGSTFAGKGTDIYTWVTSNTWTIVGASFVAWSLILSGLQFLLKVNILKIIVLVGTFALAMAFAGNDLVNFIGVPLAGISSFKAWVSSGVEPDAFMMSALSKKVPTGILYLLLAGTIMVVTLWISKKSKAVTKTSLDLSRQSHGDERFESNALARALVRLTIKINKFYERNVSEGTRKKVTKQFDLSKEIKEKDQSFDLIRASVNLMVAGILISIGTSLKLPLSTTYVTFMVAMGTSLADKAWGRESAVYRVSGVVTVISGWFVTALVAFTAAFIFANIVNWGGLPSALVLLIIAGISVVRSQFVISKKEKKKAREAKKKEKAPKTIIANCGYNVVNVLNSEEQIYRKAMKALFNHDRKALKKMLSVEAVIGARAKELKDNIFSTIKQLEQGTVDTAPYYVQVLDYLREITHSLHYIVEPAFKHVDNQHKPMQKEMYEGFDQLQAVKSDLSRMIIDAISDKDYSSLDDIFKKQQELLSITKSLNKAQVKQIKKGDIGTRNSMLFFNILAETKNTSLFMVNLVKSHRDFIIEYNKGEA